MAITLKFKLESAQTSTQHKDINKYFKMYHFIDKIRKEDSKVNRAVFYVKRK